MSHIAPVQMGSARGSPLMRAAKRRAKGYDKLAMPRGVPTLCGRLEGATYVLEIRCKDAMQMTRVAERISREVLGC